MNQQHNARRTQSRSSGGNEAGSASEMPMPDATRRRVDGRSQGRGAVQRGGEAAELGARQVLGEAVGALIAGRHVVQGHGLVEEPAPTEAP